jgi:hypothetical protein
MIQEALFTDMCRCLAAPAVKDGMCRSCYARHYRSRHFFGGHHEAVLRRDRRSCRACGANRQIVVHHRKPGIHTTTHLITLCARCHARIHRSFVLRCWVSAMTVELWQEMHKQSPMQLQLALVPEDQTNAGLLIAA